MARLRTLAVLLLAVLAAGCAQVQRSDGPERLRVLFVGNSLTHTNDLPAVVATLARGFGTEIESLTIAPGGCEPSAHPAAGMRS